MSRQRTRNTPGTSSRAVTQDQEFGAAAQSSLPTADDFATPTRQSGSGTEQTTKEKAQQLAGQVQQKATQRVESGLARGKSQAAQTLGTVAESLITTAQQLRDRNQEPVSRYVDQAADRIHRLSNYLQNTDVSEIVDRTEAFARRRPALFLGGAFAIGVLGARFLKSSNRRVEGGTWRAEGGGRGGQRHIREGITGVADLSTSEPREEWAAGAVEVSGLADVSTPTAQTQSLRDSGFNRDRNQLDFGTVTGGPEAPGR